MLSPGTNGDTTLAPTFSVNWPWMLPVEPGNYALVYPIWRYTDGEAPGTLPTEAVATVVAVTTDGRGGGASDNSVESASVQECA